MTDLEIYDDSDRRIAIANITAKTRTFDDIVLAEAGRRRNVPVGTSAVSAGRILGTPELVARIVTHLLDNAARHGTGRVEVGLTNGGRRRRRARRRRWCVRAARVAQRRGVRQRS